MSFYIENLIWEDGTIYVGLDLICKKKKTCTIDEYLSEIYWAFARKNLNQIFRLSMLTRLCWLWIRYIGRSNWENIKWELKNNFQIVKHLEKWATKTNQLFVKLFIYWTRILTSR